MGRSTLASTVPFSVNIGEVSSVFEDYLLFQDELSDHDESNKNVPTLKGWEYESAEYKKLYTEKFSKNGMSVHIVNEDEYANGGGECYTVFSDSRAALVAFMEEMDLEIEEILENEAVMQTL